ncbi:MAG: MFS transporter [Paenibacillus sp.]|nr:MFS transporter [Paenibacillus sp.]
MFSAILLVPLYLQSGYTTLAQALASMTFMTLGGKFFDKWGARPLAVVGLTLVSTALFLLSQITVDTEIVRIVLALILMGAGMGLTMMPLNTHILNSAPRRLVNRVTPLTSATQQVVSSFAIAGLTGYLTSRINEHMLEPASAGNVLVGSASGFGDTLFLAACIAVAAVLLSVFLRKPRIKPCEEVAVD